MNRSGLRQSGAALISALLIVAIVAIVSTELLKTMERWQNADAARDDAAQARWLALAGVDYARAILADDARRGAADHLGEIWANQLPPTEVEGGWVSGSLEDLQGRWNLNNLAPSGNVDTAALLAYRRLLSALGLPEGLAFTLADWLDADELPSPEGGAESDYYLAQKPPSRAANRPLADFEELSRVRGYDADVMARLRPHVAVLEGAQPVNLNTASPLLLTIAQPGLSLLEAETLAAQRKSKYFADYTDFRRRLSREITPPAFLPSTASRHFMARLEVRYGLIHIRYEALLRRNINPVGSIASGGNDWPELIYLRAK